MVTVTPEGLLYKRAAAEDRAVTEVAHPAAQQLIQRQRPVGREHLLDLFRAEPWAGRGVPVSVVPRASPTTYSSLR